MLIFLLGFECMLMLLTILTQNMIDRKYTQIKKNIKIYNNPRAYRTEKNTAFMDKLIKFYWSNREISQKELEEEIIMAMETEKIGSFNYVSIYNVAFKAKYIMVAVILLQGGIIYLNHLMNDKYALLWIGISCCCLLFTLIFTIAKGGKPKRLDLIGQLEHYIVQVYPQEQQVLVNKRERSLKRNLGDDLNTKSEAAQLIAGEEKIENLQNDSPSEESIVSKEEIALASSRKNETESEAAASSQLTAEDIKGFINMF